MWASTAILTGEGSRRGPFEAKNKAPTLSSHPALPRERGSELVTCRVVVAYGLLMGGCKYESDRELARGGSGVRRSVRQGGGVWLKVGCHPQGGSVAACFKFGSRLRGCVA